MRIPFDIKYRPQIESGKYKVVDKDNHNIRIICWDKKSEKKYGYHIVGLVEFGPNHEESTYYTIDGKGRLRDKHPCLFIITPEPELSAFEDALKDCVNMRRPENPMTDEGARNNATILRAIAFDEFKENEASYMKEAYERGKAEALRTRATEFTENLAKSGLDKDSIPYHLIEFMCNLYDCQNWKEIEDTAELYVTRIKAAALKDLPRWKKHEEASDKLATVWNDFVTPWLDWGGHRIAVRDLEKLPGFKEDEK